MRHRDHRGKERAHGEGFRESVGLKSIELFTGAGGLALGTHLAGFEHAAMFERDEDACSTLRTNICSSSVPGIHSWSVFQEDVRNVDFAQYDGVDLIAGGPPCQPFSIGGKHAGHVDSRDMIPEFVRAVRLAAPRAFIMENVRGLLRPRFADYLGYSLLRLSYPTIVRKDGESKTEHLRRLRAIHSRASFPDLHYRVNYCLFNAADYGVPQVRLRIFVVGFRGDLGCQWTPPGPTHSKDRLATEQWVTGRYWKRHGLKEPRHRPEWARAASLSNESESFLSCEAWRTVRDAIGDLPEPRENGGADRVANHRLVPGAKTYVGHSGSALDLPSKALKAGDHGVPGGENTVVLDDRRVRYLTVREAARVQTFPDQWFFEGAWTEAMRQLGNAVPVKLASTVASSVASTLRGEQASLNQSTNGSEGAYHPVPRTALIWARERVGSGYGRGLAREMAAR